MNLSTSLDNLAFWERFLSIPSRANHNVEQLRYTFATGWSLPLLLGILLGAFAWFLYCYRKEGKRPANWVKGLLLGLRMIAFASLFLLLAQPTLRIRHSDQIRSRVLVFFDTSESMNKSDRRLPNTRVQIESEATALSQQAVRQATRIERLNAAVNQSHILETLSKSFQIKAYTFASQAKAVPLPANPKEFASHPLQVSPDTQGGDSTQIGEALRKGLDESTGQPIAGALVISDGANNLGEDPLLSANIAKQIPAPVSTSGIGDPTPTKDIALLSVLADDVVRTNNTVAVYAALSQRGYAGKTAEVTLQRGTTVLQKQTVRWGADDRKQEVKFVYVPVDAGRFEYSVSVSTQPDEITKQNNRRTFMQSVVGKKLRVLYVEGEPRYEYRYLKNAILRDKSLEFACLLLSSPETTEGTIPIKEFPKDEKALFDFDIVILGDVPRSQFSQVQLDALHRFVEDRGGSLLVIAGEQHTPHEYAGTPLEAVLPVSISATPNPVLTEEPFQWQRTPEGKGSPILELEDNPSTNEQVWGNLQGMYWAYGAEKAKPGATVLAVHPNRSNSFGQFPLVAYQNYGSGKCYIQLVDSTWHWRWRVGDRHFYRYWGQVFRTLTPKEIPGNSRYVQLNADRNAYRFGEKVVLSTRLLNRFYRPIKAERVVAKVKAGNGETKEIVLQAAPNAPGLFTADYVPPQVGKFEITVQSPEIPDAKATTSFVVESLALELQKPEMDEAMLKRIASAGGGKYYPLNRLSDWAKSLTDNSLQVSNEEEIELWDAPLFLLLFILPIGLEWLIRKRSGLL